MNRSDGAGDETAPERPARLRRAGRRLADLQRRHPVLQGLALLVLFAYGAATLDGFASKLNIHTMLVLAAFLGLAALGQTLVILIGGIDLSIPGFILLGGTMIVQLVGASQWPFPVALAFALAIAVVLGAFTGWICHRFRIESMIVTLAIDAILVGAMQGWIGGVLTGTPPEWLTELASPSAKTFGVDIPPLLVLWTLVAIAVGIVLSRTVWGRWVYATGSNRRAADLALVPTRRMWIAGFAASAVCSTLVGVLLAGFAPGDQSVGHSYLFQSLIAVIVGGTAFGARGDYWRTVLGALLLTVLTTVLIGNGYSEARQQILFGAVVLVVVGAYARDPRLRDLI